MISKLQLVRVEHRSQRSDWGTPDHILQRVRLIAPIGLDPATDKSNPTDAGHIYTLEDDGLEQPWDSHGLVYVNAPYGRGHNAKWGLKMAAEAREGVEIVALVAARTGSRWWRFLWEADRICFIAGRVRFKGADTGAPFDSALCYWGERAKRFDAAMKDLGRLITP